MRFLRNAMTIAGKDLRLRLRDRSAIVLAFIAPLALAWIISSAFGRIDVPFRATYAVADADASALSGSFERQVLRGNDLRKSVTVRKVGTEAEARKLAASGEVAAAFVLPAGFEQSVRSGRPAVMTVVRSAGSGVGADIAEAIAHGFLDQLESVRLSVLTSLGQGTIGIEELVRQAAAQPPPVTLSELGVGGRPVSPATYFGPGMALFFLFFTVGFSARSLFAERQTKTMHRLMAAPVSPGALLTGKALPSFVLGLTSLAVIFGALSLSFGAAWGDPLAVVVMAVVTVLALLGVASLVQTLARNDQQANGYVSVLGTVFALAGGSFFPLHLLPPVMQRVSLLTPNGWALRGFTSLAYDGGGLASVGPNIAALLLIGAVTGAVAVSRSRRLVAA